MSDILDILTFLFSVYNEKNNSLIKKAPLDLIADNAFGKLEDSTV